MAHVARQPLLPPGGRAIHDFFGVNTMIIAARFRHQDQEKFSDRVKHLEQKVVAAKKLQKVAKQESKHVEKVRKARRQVHDVNPTGCPEPMHRRQAQQKAYKNQNKKRNQQRAEWKKVEKETGQARDAHGLLASRSLQINPW